MPNKLSQFWQELKRRNVVRVITVYAGAAFVIIELINNITEPLRLPEWTPTLVIILLAIGFPIVTIFSWIYDIHPEEGLVKTESAEKVKAEDIPKSSNSWKIASYISFVVIVGLIVLNIIPRTGKKEILDKSIAVIPFESLSDDPEKQYQADGVMDAILLHLSKIEDLRVISRTSVEQYRGTDKTVSQICEELDVAYVLEGSFRRYGDQARLIVQLIQPGREGHVWAEQYDRDWGDIFVVESEVAQTVAGELQAVITPEVKQRIEKVPTSNLTALDLYQRGQEKLLEYGRDKTKKYILDEVEDLYLRALKYDDSFAEAYAGLADVYIAKHGASDYLTEAYLDSALILADLALSYDRTLSEAYMVRGRYFRLNGDYERAEEALDMAITYNPNDWRPYYDKARFFGRDEAVKILENAYKAASLHNGPELVNILRTISETYIHTGFDDLGESVAAEVAELGDSLNYYSLMAYIESNRNNYQKALEYQLNIHRIDTTENLGLAQIYMNAGQYEKSLEYYKKYFDNMEANGVIDTWNYHRLGYAYWINGYKEQGDYCFKKCIEYSAQEIQLERLRSEELFAYYDIAGVYSFYGDTEKALDYLRIFNQREIIHGWFVHLIHTDPLLDNIRDEPEFQQILADIEAKYQAEHERVRQWLEENDML